MECLDETTVLALVQGELREAEARAKRGHLARCAACRALVGQVAAAARTGNVATGTTNGVALAATEAAPGHEDHVDHLGDDEFMARLATGTMLDDRYRVERVLGAGGMGVVALATHVALQRPVAIKLLHARSLASPEAVARFVREARAAVAVASDHVVRVLDVASLESGEPYIVMEYLVGRDARAHLAERKSLPVGEVVDLVAQACLGVGRAHRAGIVHRDLKPANLYVIDAEERDVPLFVKVLDFGVSKIRRDELAEHEVSLTRSTAFLGTPLYMSPEQIRASRDVDARADVWALGCILYELLVGRAPFRRESLGLTCAAILVEDAEALSRTRGDIPRAIDSIVMRCLQKERDARFADGFDLASALAPFASPATRAEIDRIVGVDARPTVPPRRYARIGAVLASLVAFGAGAALLTRNTAPPVAGNAALTEGRDARRVATATSAPTEPGAVASVAPKVEASVAPSVSTKPPITHAAPPQPVAPKVSVAPAVMSAPAVVASPVAPAASPPPMNPEFGPRK